MLLFGDQAVSKGSAIVGGALEDGEVSDLPGDLGDELHCRGAGSDDADPFASQVHALLGPAPGVARGPLEVVDALEVGHVVGRQQADGGDQELTPDAVAVIHRQFPAGGLFIVDAGGHVGVEADVAAQVELVGNVVEVALVLGLSGIQFLPIPFLEQFLGEGIAVGIALGVEARSGVAVPVPGTAHA